jgi:hypothetical protein
VSGGFVGKVNDLFERISVFRSFPAPGISFPQVDRSIQIKNVTQKLKALMGHGHKGSGGIISPRSFHKCICPEVLSMIKIFGIIQNDIGLKHFY